MSYLLSGKLLLRAKPIEKLEVVIRIDGPNKIKSVYSPSFPVNVERPGQTVANLVTVQLGAGHVNVYGSIPTHLVVDVFGYFLPSGNTSDGRCPHLPRAETRNSSMITCAPLMKSPYCASHRTRRDGSCTL